MKVREAIAELSGHDPEAEVVVACVHDNWGSYQLVSNIGLGATEAGFRNEAPHPAVVCVSHGTLDPRA